MRFALLVERFGSTKKAYTASRKELQEVLGDGLIDKFIEFRDEFDAQKKLKECDEKNIAVISQEDKRYPPQFGQIPDPPICLYVKGPIEMFDFSNDSFFGIVGTRTPTSYGVHIAKTFSRELTACGLVIVSGLALGIDAVAHRACLEEKGKTIAFLGCGVDIPYPHSNKPLYQTIIESGGLVVSEFPPGMTVLRGLFIARNRLVSGLSKGVLVVEGAKDSGALITARYAAEQGKEVFAPPAPITSEMSAAPNILLKEGAKLVTSVEDILRELTMQYVPRNYREIEMDADSNEKQIFIRLKQEPKLADELSIELQEPIGIILQTLSSLEIQGVVEKNSEGKYQLR